MELKDMKDYELQAELDKGNVVIAEIKERQREITVEQNTRLAKARISEVLRAIPASVRDQVLKAEAIKSEEVVPAPGN